MAREKPAWANNYSSGVISYLGTLGGVNSYAVGLNNIGQIVGGANTGSATHAFIDSGGLMTDLNSEVTNPSGWMLSDAFPINDLGQIVGDGTIGGQIHAI